MVVRYDYAHVAWSDYRPFLERLIEREGATRVCELGGGANPALPLDVVRDRGLRYVVVDASVDELAKAPEGYEKLQADAAAPGFRPPGEFDLACSVMVAEHLADPATFHRNVHRLLRPGGIAFHFFPTLYSLPYVANRVLPDPVSRAILHRIQPHRDDAGHHAKFKAYYRWCRGPTKRQIARFESVGFAVEEYVGFYGHGYYSRVKPLHALEQSAGSFLVRRPVANLTSFAYVVLRKR